MTDTNDNRTVHTSRIDTRWQPITGRLSASFTGLRALVVLAITALAAGGCSRAAGPELVELDAGQYDAAFDAAVQVARDHGMQPGLRDRRSGTIATEPARSATVLEPWLYDGFTGEQLVENTIAQQRRLARFEFSAPGFQSTSATESEPLTGPMIFRGSRTRPDLTQYEGKLELRVRVYVERSNTFGRRRSTWTRLKTTRTKIPGVDRNFWTPTTRDENLERRLLAAVKNALEPGG